MGQTILLADDSITIQKVIELTFSDEDFALHTVGNGQKAIEEIRTVKPDIVLCDIIMPEKNGYEVCEFIKSSDDLRHIPVLLLTGAFEPFDQERARKAGCDGFLAKPFEPQTLISKVRELLAAAAQAPTVQAPIVSETAELVAPPAAVAPPPVTPEPTPPAAMEPPTVELSTNAEPPPVPGTPSFDEGSTIMADSFTVEAGERELSVEAEDRTILLNEEESPTAPSEDIWSEVQQTPPVPSPQPVVPSADAQDDASTVFMAPAPEPPPSEPVPAEETSDAAGFDDFAAMPVGGPTNPTDSGTWILPSPDEAQVAQPAEPSPPLTEPVPVEPIPSTPEPAPLTAEPEPLTAEPEPQMTEPMQPLREPELTPLGDFGGFDDFSAAESPGTPTAPDVPEISMPQAPEPADLEVEDPTFFASADTFKMPAPEPPAAPVSSEPDPPLASPEPPAAPAPPEPLAPTLPEAPFPDISTPPAPPSLSPEMPFSEPPAVEPEPAAPPPAIAQFDDPFPMVEPTPVGTGQTPVGTEPTPLEEPTPAATELAPLVDEPMIEDPTPIPQTLERASKTLNPGELDASQLPTSVDPTPIQPEPHGLMSEPPVSQEPTFEEAFVSSQVDLPTGEPVEEPTEPTLVTKAKKQAAAAESVASSDELDVLAERVAEKVITKLSDKIIKEIAWEIVPDLAQTLIQKEIDELKAKIPE